MLPPGAPRIPADIVGPAGLMHSPFDDPPRHPAAIWAVGHLQDELRTSGELAEGVAVSALGQGGRGTMLGVLVVRDERGEVGYLRAFAGEVAGHARLAGWAPPLYDAQAYAERRDEAARQSARLEARWAEARPALEAEWGEVAARVHGGQRAVDEILEARRAARASRRAARASGTGSSELEARAQHDNARFTERLRAARAELEAAQRAQSRLRRRRDAAGRLRRVLGLRAMHRLHQTYAVPTAAGQVSLFDVFAPQRPPGGAGDCAGAKLVAWARTLGVVPVALAETWWGPDSGGRASGQLYPACEARCGPLMPVMLDGFSVAAPVRTAAPSAPGLRILYEDDLIVVVNKPAGLLSMPGREVQDSVQTRLRELHPEIRAAHRLDEDTSGVLLLAKTQDALRWLHAEFAGRRVHKRYVAVLDGDVEADSGEITLRLRADPDARPRQVVDPSGKKACTRWRVSQREAGRTRVCFEPETGRTHQLRVHAASGLGAPIVGDRLYGEASERLLLHAERIGLVAPDGSRWVFEAPAPF